MSLPLPFCESPHKTGSNDRIEGDQVLVFPRYNKSMKITKFVHSCVLVEVDGKRILIDPGEYTWVSGQLTDEHLSNLDYLLITHEHYDHCHLEAIKAVQGKSPNVKIKAGPAVVGKLQKDGIIADSSNTDLVSLDVGEHSHLWEGLPVFENTKMTVAGKLLHVGDSMDATQTPDVLCLPIFGPWLNGTVADAANVITKLKPKYVVPIHDWHYNQEARNGFMERLTDWFKDKGTQVIGTELAKTYEIEV